MKNEQFFHENRTNKFNAMVINSSLQLCLIMDYRKRKRSVIN